MRSRADRFRRRQEAEARQAERDGRGPAAQVKALDSRLGPGEGATRERARLARERKG